VSDPAPDHREEQRGEPVRHLAQRPHASDHWLFTCSVAVLYLAVAALSNLDAWTHGIGHTIQTAGGGDVPEEIWFLAQTPWAIVHGHNPFVNNWINAPIGLNLMDNTTMPVLGILGAPITFVFGPIATFNVMIDLSFAGSAMAFYLMARRLVRWRPAAFAGGLLYGFSPFAAAEGIGHLFLVANFVPPLVVLFLDRFIRTKSDPPWRTGVVIGALLAVQFYISSEVFASLILMMFVAAVIGGVYWVARRPPVDVGALAKAGGVAIGVLAVLAGVGAWTALLGPQHVHGPEQSPATLAGISSDPVGLVVPTSIQQFTLGHAALGDSLTAQRDSHWHVVVDAPQENGSYVGVPLLAVLLVAVIVLRRNRLVLFSAAMAAVGFVLSMGSYLHVHGTKTAVPLPFDVLAHLPLIQSGAASRYVLFFWLFAALVFSCALDALYRRVDAADRPGDRLRAAGATVVLALCALLPLVPAWPYTSAPAYVPTWFTTAGRGLPDGTTVVVYPFANPVDPAAMTWQAMAHMKFRMPGGYAVFTGADGRASFNSAPSALSTALSFCSLGYEPTLAPAVVRTELRRWDASLAVVSVAAKGSSCAAHLFDSAYGAPRSEGGMLVWDTGLGTSAGT
jgi:hypothetical protein